MCVQSNALVNVANNQGNTALHEAVRGGHQSLVELLLRSGASPGPRNKRQRTPLDCAYELGGKVQLLFVLVCNVSVILNGTGGPK